MLKLYLYGYLNQLQSSRRLEREAGRNVELMWLTGKLAPDFKTIADFRRGNGEAIRAVCRQIRASVPQDRPHRWRHGCGRWQPFQGGEHTRPPPTRFANRHKSSQSGCRRSKA
jgi:hypothetical protein